MIHEFVLGEYQIDNSKPKITQHKKALYDLVSQGQLTIIISELIEDRDFEARLKVLKDEAWPSHGGFGRTDKYLLKLEVEQ